MSDAELLERLLSGACEVDELLLAALLAEGLPAPAAVRRSLRGPWRAGAALLLGGAIALGSAGAARATPAAAPARAAAAPVGSARGAARAALAAAPLEVGVVLRLPALAEAQQGGTPAEQRYVVQAGDTLSGIAVRFYGSAAYWPAIFERNRAIIANPNLIYPGQALSIPAVPSPIGTTTPGGATPGGATPGGGQTGQGPGQYTVRPGDSLWSIAQFAYGNPARWVDIYNANAAAIGANPSLIFSGTVLTIPA